MDRGDNYWRVAKELLRLTRFVSCGVEVYILGVSIVFICLYG